MKSIIFAKRNFKELLRDKINLIFCFAFPVALFLVMQLIIAGIGTENLDMTPQFKIENLSGSIAVFSLSFLMLFVAMLISGDRTSSFQARLSVSPMKPINFVLGYILPLVPIAIIQITVTYIVSVIFGLPISFNILLAFVGLIPAMLLFIALGVLIGSIFTGSATSGISSLIVNVSAILGGMFFPLQTMTGTLVTVANVLPFAPALKVVNCCITGDFTGFWLALLTVMLYVVAFFVLAVFVFMRKIKSDNK